MRAAAIKLKNYARDASETLENRRRILRLLVVALAALGICYLSFLSITVWNIVERRALDARARELTNSVGELEVSYFSALQAVDLPLSERLGFFEVKPKFLTRKSYEHVTAQNTGSDNGADEI